MSIQIGDPVILKDAKGLKKYGLVKDMTGFCNNLVEFPGDGEFLMFQPDGVEKFYYVDAKRFALDEERLGTIEASDESTD